MLQRHIDDDGVGGGRAECLLNENENNWILTLAVAVKLMCPRLIHFSISGLNSFTGNIGRAQWTT